ncbi:hypothetical protein R75465_07573 [Paraburkholderia aspalathi]|uniref:hypothetical protein n=1 Tax=Paraburkholderia aspalathi TaxID=1324617 RepID=UPI001B1D1CF0|nr:hypothetical protein [Paraburkholderia aspalathi]CAE6859252.1 hypothetical protein R75465_07573 [Paraburkholderia aspalathi]
MLHALVTGNLDAISGLSARTVVLARFLDATLPRLTRGQCAEIVVAFREGVEETMCIADDIPLPDKYHTTLLEQVNVVLAALNRKIDVRC